MPYSSKVSEKQRGYIIFKLTSMYQFADGGFIEFWDRLAGDYNAKVTAIEQATKRLNRWDASKLIKLLEKMQDTQEAFEQIPETDFLELELALRGLGVKIN